MVSVCNAELVARLIKMPESGMGYQLLSFGDHSRPTHVALNAALIVDLREPIEFDLLAELSRRSGPETETFATQGLREFEVPDEIENGKLWVSAWDYRPLYLGFITIPPIVAIPIASAPAPNPALHLFYSGVAQPTDSHTRYCAFSPARRPLNTATGPQYPTGTYATSLHDANCANNGAAVVGRSGLPARAPANYTPALSVTVNVPPK
jgi:hypothetical protein